MTIFAILKYVSWCLFKNALKFAKSTLTTFVSNTASTDALLGAGVRALAAEDATTHVEVGVHILLLLGAVVFNRNRTRRAVPHAQHAVDAGRGIIQQTPAIPFLGSFDSKLRGLRRGFAKQI